MKKLLLLLMFITSIAKAQFYLFSPINNVPYYTSIRHKSIMINNGTLYESRNGMVQSKNLNANTTNYIFRAPIWELVPDNTGHFTYWGDDYIEVYDTLLNDWVDINNGQFWNVDGIDLAPNGNIWVLGYQKMGIYSAGNWTFVPTNASGSISVANDSTAYIGTHDIFRYHSGVFDTLAPLPSGAIPRDMDTDTNGDLWVAAESKLVHYSGNTSQYFDNTNTPLGSDKFLKINIGTDNHIWISSQTNKIYEFDGTNWLTHQISTQYKIDNFTLDSLNLPWIVVADIYSSQCRYANIYHWNGSSFFPQMDFEFNPYQNIKSISNVAIANDEGAFFFNFNWGYYYFSFSEFLGMPVYPEAADLNCLRTHNPTTSSINDLMFGTDYGVFNPSYYYPGLDTSVLPNDTINYIDNFNGTDYICTNGGLLIYNGVFYNTFDTSNSPLPSNKITFISIEATTPATLHIGTDKGFATYYNNQWTVYDSSTIGSSNFYVTGIVSYDTITYVTTMGNGLIEFYSSGGYQIFNTAIGNFQDDSLYYVLKVEISMCSSTPTIIIGTQSHGIAEIYPIIPTIQYNNQSTGWPFNQSKSGADLFNTAGFYLVSTNTGMYYASICGGTSQLNTSEGINVFPNPSDGIFTVQHSGIASIEIYNTMGELVRQQNLFGNLSTVDLTGIPKEVYIIKMKDSENKISVEKIIFN